MSEPTMSSVHIDSALTDYSRAYFQNPGSYIWRAIAPVVDVAKESGKYFVYDKTELLRTVAQKKAPNSEAPVRTYKISNDNYACDVWSIAVDVSEQVRANADPALDPEEDAVRVAVQDMNIALDVQAASEFFVAGVWGTDDATKNWSDAASNPLGDISTAVRTVLQNTGYRLNTLTIGPDAWYGCLDQHPDLLSRIPDTQMKILTPALLGAMTGLNVVVAESIRNTAGEGLTGSYAFNYTDHALLTYKAPFAGLRNPTAAATFNWTGLLGSAGGVRVQRHEMPWKDAMPRVQVEAALDFKVTASDLGYLFTDVSA